MRTLRLSNLIIVLLAVGCVSAASRLVPDEYPNIQAAINACNYRDTVIIAPGTYTGTGNRDIDFLAMVITVRSVEPNNSAVVASTVIDCQNAGRAFYFRRHEDRDSVLEGLTIINGQDELAGGGIRCQTSSPTIRFCVIEQCTTQFGGGISSACSDAAITHCTLRNNHASFEGGAVELSYCRGALISNCVLVSNSALLVGGGISASNSDPLIANSIIAKNSAVTTDPLWGYGGGIYFFKGSPRVINCTIANNSASNSGGGIFCHYTKAAIANSIIWANTAAGSSNSFPGTTVSYSDVEGGYSGTGNIDIDPFFVDPDDEDYHLSAGSPCIDAGDPANIPVPGETDIDGDPRQFGGRVDMGADESFNDALAMGVFPRTVRFNMLEGQADSPEETVQIWKTGIGALNWRITNDCSWLQVDPPSGTCTNEPNQVVLTADAAGLHWGTYDCIMTVSDPCAVNSPRTVAVTLNLIGPEIELSRGSIEFSANEGDTVSLEQTFTIRNSGGGLLSWQISSDCNWLDVSPTAGTSRGESDVITLTADVSDLAWGHYNCNLVISDPNASNNPAALPVSLDLVGPLLWVSSNRFDFEAGKENPTPPDQILSIRNTGGGTLDWQITAPDSCHWLSIYPAAGRSTGESNEVTLSVNAAGMEYGSYSCQLTISDPAAQDGLETVWVYLTLPAPRIAVEPTTFQFYAWQTDPCLFERTISIQNTGGDTLNWEIVVPDDCSWLSIHPLSGRSGGEVNDVTLTVDTAGLAAGFYDCELSIIDPNAANSPQVVEVGLYVGIERGWLFVPNEFATIQSAIDWASDGDIVAVAPGTYTGDGNYNIRFRGKAITVRSIDPNDPNVVAATIVDCNNRGGGFIFDAYEDAISILSGFTIVNSKYGSRGGGPAVACYNSSPFITNCVIARNSGGGISVYRGNPVIRDCTIANNSGSYGIYVASESFPTIENCIISGNSAYYYGGGICCWGSFGLVIRNSIVTGNKSERYGGGFYCGGNDAVISGCTIADNAAGVKGGGICRASGSVTVSNSIVWGNYAPTDAAISGDCAVRYSSVEGGWAGEGNIDADPCFAEPGYWGHIDDPNIHVEPNDSHGTWVEGDYHLKSEHGRWNANGKAWVFDAVTSLCIDAGDPNLDWSAELWPHGKRINLGAFGGTSQASMSPNNAGNIADLDLDGFVYRMDLPILLGAWLSDAAPLREDLTRDGFVNFPDFGVFAHNYRRPALPAQAEIVSPLDGAVSVSRAPVLSWLSEPNALWHDVYLGIESPGVFQSRVSATTFGPDVLDKNTWYYWRIDEMNPAGITTGEVWSFQTGPYPGPATVPNPPDGAVSVSTYPALSWQGGDGANSHDVYFGTSSPGEFQGNQVETTFAPGSLLYNTRYYWRIDEVNDLGTTTGAIWSFTTTAAKPRLCFPADTVVWADGELVPIVEVMPGQKAGMPDSAAEIEWIQEHGVGTYDCYDVVFESGNSIVVVHSHDFLTVAGEWVAVENLSSGSKLRSLNGPITITSVVKRAMPFVGNAYNLKIKGANMFFVGEDGVAAVDCSQLPKE